VQIKHFHSVEAPLAVLLAEVPANPFRADHDIDDYEWAADADGVSLLPSIASAFWSPFLYRGQTQRHQPCVPGVFRGLSFVDHPQKLSRLERARCFLARVRLEEFLSALAEHPATEFAQQIRLVTYPEAIAQHYEMLTDRIDLTQDPQIAAFFATNERALDGRWRPKTKGTGVIYRLDFPFFLRCLRARSADLEWIGRQALPRPGEQRAWTFRLALGRDLEAYPIDIFTFDHHRSAGERLNAKFDGGRTLFPTDVLSEVAAKIRASTSIARQLVANVLKLDGCDGELFDRELEASGGYLSAELGISVADRAPISFSPAQLAAARLATEELTDSFVGSVRAVRADQRSAVGKGAISSVE
jgi:hypothetical protein